MGYVNETTLYQLKTLQDIAEAMVEQDEKIIKKWCSSHEHI